MAEQSGESTQALRSWWAGFKKNKKKPEPPPERLVFGVPLQEGIKYANVAISLTNDRGESFIYGYVPIVVAKCGVFLKEKATDVEGIFRLSGSAKRINELQQIFNHPPKYGKGLDWTGYTVHDAANVFRRYLNLLPQPIVPLEFYERFRDPLRGHQSQPVGDTAAQAHPLANLDHPRAITTYQNLITQIPDLNRQLLLYVLDLLSVFASKADVNRMTSANLSAIFQPGMLSHPDHNLSPPDYRLNQDVILFLIDNQDSFLIGMSGTAADEQTVRDLQNAAAQPGTPGKSGIGRSVSNASAGADSLRKLGGVRRNLSVSSKNSKHSSNLNTPNTPQSGAFGGSGIHRSNTVPSKRSPALSSTRGALGVDSPTASVALSPAMVPLAARHSPTLQPGTDASAAPAGLSPTVQPATPTTESKEKLLGKEPSGANDEGHLTVETPPNKRRTSGLLKQHPSSDGKDKGQPNKLKKKRAPTEPTRSANSSSHSLSNAEYIDSLPTPNANFDTDPISTTAPRIGDGLEESMGPSTLQSSQQPSDQTLKGKSPVGSVHSKSSVTDHSEADHNGTKAEKEEKKRRWRFSSAARKHHGSASEASPHRLGGNANAGKSSGSMASANKSRPSLSNDGGASHSVPLEAVSSEITQPSMTSDNSGNKDKEGEDVEHKKGGIFGRIKARVEKSREERKDKGTEKERAKSPPRSEHNTERSGSKHSLSAIAHEIMPARNRSIDAGAPSQEPLPENSVLLVQERLAPEHTTTTKESVGEPLPVAKPTAEAPATTTPLATQPAIDNPAASSTTPNHPVHKESALVEELASPAVTEQPPSQQLSQQPIAEDPVAERRADEATTLPPQTETVQQQPIASAAPAAILEQFPASAAPAAVPTTESKAVEPAPATVNPGSTIAADTPSSLPAATAAHTKPSEPAQSGLRQSMEANGRTGPTSTGTGPTASAP